MTPHRILESVGLAAEPLTDTVRDYRLSGSPAAPEGRLDIEQLAAAVESLASRLAAALDLLGVIAGQDDRTAALTREVAAVILPDQQHCAELAAQASGIRTPVTASRPVFGHPGLTSVSLAVVDDRRQSFTVTSYLVHLASKTVFRVLPGEPPASAAARVQPLLEHL